MASCGFELNFSGESRCWKCTHRLDGDFDIFWKMCIWTICLLKNETKFCWTVWVILCNLNINVSLDSSVSMFSPFLLFVSSLCWFLFSVGASSFDSIVSIDFCFWVLYKWASKQKIIVYAYSLKYFLYFFFFQSEWPLWGWHCGAMG